MPNHSSKRPKRPTDINQLAKALVREATEEPAPQVEAASPEPEVTPDPIREAARALGKRGGLKGGKARAASMTPERRTEIAKNAAAKRWERAKD
ncbi:MAG: histone [Planctomycetota bacterium]|nr:histone [Planctomycetota bacterium]